MTEAAKRNEPSNRQLVVNTRGLDYNRMALAREITDMKVGDLISLRFESVSAQRDAVANLNNRLKNFPDRRYVQLSGEEDGVYDIRRIR